MIPESRILGGFAARSKGAGNITESGAVWSAFVPFVAPRLGRGEGPIFPRLGRGERIPGRAIAFRAGAQRRGGRGSTKFFSLTLL